MDARLPVQKRRGLAPQIGVVVPTFNRKDSVVKTVDSLLNQDTDRPYEIVVVDDGSIDGTFEYLQEKYGSEIRSVEDRIAGYYDERNPRGKITVVRQRNKHYAGALNTGIKTLLKRGANFFTHQDSDDIALPNRLEDLACFLEQNPEVDFAHAKSQDIDAEDNVLENGPYQKYFRTIWENWRTKGMASENQVKNGGFMHNQAIMLRKSVIDTLGEDNLYWEGLKRGVDWDFAIKARNNGVKFGFLDEYVSQSRVGDVSGMTGVSGKSPYELAQASLDTDNFLEKILYYKRAVELADGDRSFLTDSREVWRDFFSTTFKVNYKRNYALNTGDLSNALLLGEVAVALNPSRENRDKLSGIERILRGEPSNVERGSGRNVLFLTPFYDNSCGVGTVAQSLAEELNNRGNNVDVLEYAPWRKQKKFRFISKSGEEVYLQGQTEVVNYFKSQGLEYDVAHSHNQVFANGFNEKLFQHLSDTPILMQVHQIVPYANEVLGQQSPNHQKEVERQRNMMNRSDRVVQLTPDLEDIACSYYGDVDTQTCSIYNFAKPSNLDGGAVRRLKTKLAPNGEKLLLYAGRLSEEKGILELLQGFRKAKEDNPNAKLVICGSRSNKEDFMAKVDAELGGLQEGKDYAYEGRVSQDELQNYYGAADFFVQPSRYEHFSVSLIESMAHKTPVIMTKVPSMRKVMNLEDKNPRNRYAFSIDNINSPDQIRDTINVALKAPRSYVKNITRNAHNLYRRELTPERVAERYEQEYDSMVAERKGAGVRSVPLAA